jgi:hypothetical protein
MTLEDLREATLTLNTNGGANLVPKIIDRLLLEYVRKYAPLRRALPRKTWGTNIYYFNQRTALPKAQVTTEAPSTTDVQATASVYNQVGFPVKHLQSQIDISTFTAQVGIVNGNLFDLELAGAAKSMAYLEEIVHMWGSAGATNNTKRPQWDGVDLLTATSNKLDAGTNQLSLAMLDNCIDSIKGVAAQELGTDWFFLLSPKMMSKVNSLFINQQRFNASMAKIFSRDDAGIPNAEVSDNLVDAGVEVATYRGIPLVTSTFMSSPGAMGAIGISAGGTGSQLAAATYYYVVEAVTKYGITTASAEVSQAATAGQNVTLTWTTPTILDAFGNAIDILSYRFFRGTATATESLYAVVPAYDASDNPVVSFVDTGVPSTASSLYTTVAQVGGNAASDGVTFPRVQTAGQVVEDIFLVPRNPEYALVAVTNEQKTQMLAPVNARTRQFAITADMVLAWRAPAFSAKLGRVRAA